jgi:hypothetical protein
VVGDLCTGTIRELLRVVNNGGSKGEESPHYPGPGSSRCNLGIFLLARSSECPSNMIAYGDVPGEPDISGKYERRYEGKSNSGWALPIQLVVTLVWCTTRG